MQDQEQEPLQEKAVATDSAPVKSKARLSPVRLSIGIALVVTAAILLTQSVSTYLDGLSTLQFKSTTATVISAHTVFNAFDQSKRAEVSFEVNAKQYKADVVVPAERVVKDKEVLNLFYDTSNPSHAALSQEVDYDNTIVRGAFGLFALCFGLLLIKKALG